jgi:hypothetical protein
MADDDESIQGTVTNSTGSADPACLFVSYAMADAAVTNAICRGPGARWAGESGETQFFVS